MICESLLQSVRTVNLDACLVHADRITVEGSSKPPGFLRVIGFLFWFRRLPAGDHRFALPGCWRVRFNLYTRIVLPEIVEQYRQADKANHHTNAQRRPDNHAPVNFWSWLRSCRSPGSLQFRNFLLQVCGKVRAVSCFTHRLIAGFRIGALLFLI